MFGHDQVIAVRMAGAAPKTINLSLFPIKRWVIQQPPCPDVCMFVEVDDKDRIDRLDLRFLVGLVAKVEGYDESRVEGLIGACMKAGASRALGSVFKRPKVPGYSPEEILKMKDTNGVLVWQQ
jgi:hypothetical protein